MDNKLYAFKFAIVDKVSGNVQSHLMLKSNSFEDASREVSALVAPSFEAQLSCVSVNEDS